MYCDLEKGQVVNFESRVVSARCAATAGALHDWGSDGCQAGAGSVAAGPMCTSGLYEGHDKASSSLPLLHSSQSLAPGPAIGVWVSTSQPIPASCSHPRGFTLRPRKQEAGKGTEPKTTEDMGVIVVGYTHIHS